MQKFFENTLESKYIKSLLMNTFLPIIDTLSVGDTAIAGKLYIIKDKIYKCTKTGIYKSYDVDGEAKFEYIKGYDFGRYYPQYSRNYYSNKEYYDHETHEELYHLLKCYKDIMGINLLPYYNLYSSNYVSNIEIDYTEDGTGEVYSKVYNSSKLIKIKVNFNRTYTVAIDNNSLVWISPVFMIKDYLMSKTNDLGEDVDITNDFISKYNYVTKYSNLSFKDPITFRIDCFDKEYLQYENYLYIIIKLPISNRSSIVVLDGDYTDIPRNQIINMENISSGITDSSLNDAFTSDLFLLQFNNGVSYPYSNRLIEYLLFHTITKYDTISNNIGMILDYISNKNVNKFTYKVWNNYLRAKIFKSVMESNSIRHLDLNGYVDKDTEGFLSKGYI